MTAASAKVVPFRAKPPKQPPNSLTALMAQLADAERRWLSQPDQSGELQEMIYDEAVRPAMDAVIGARARTAQEALLALDYIASEGAVDLPDDEDECEFGAFDLLVSSLVAAIRGYLLEAARREGELT